MPLSQLSLDYMNSKRSCLILLILVLFSREGFAHLRPVLVGETSRSGKLLRLNLGARQGLKLGEPVLLRSMGQKIAAGRVVQVEDSSTVVALMERYTNETPQPDSEYELLFGEPFIEAANLPDYISDREAERPNPANEKFWTNSEDNANLELDDEKYNPEISIRPKFPEKASFRPHNITVGANLFRNRNLPTQYDANGDFIESRNNTTYSGFSIRYAYVFSSHYWFSVDKATQLSAEIGFGIYSFTHTFDNGRTVTGADIRIIPVQMELRYLVEVNRYFRVYPYLGYQYNIVGANGASQQSIQSLQGGRLAGGGGVQLVMSDSIDTRVEAGSDGVLGGLVVKF